MFQGKGPTTLTSYKDSAGGILDFALEFFGLCTQYKSVIFYRPVQWK